MDSTPQQRSHVSVGPATVLVGAPAQRALGLLAAPAEAVGAGLEVASAGRAHGRVRPAAGRLLGDGGGLGGGHAGHPRLGGGGLARVGLVVRAPAQRARVDGAVALEAVVEGTRMGPSVGAIVVVIGSTAAVD